MAGGAGLFDRRNTGQSLVEVTVGIVVLLFVVLALTDLAVIILACSQNNAACRIAVRAAASGDPSEALERAQVAIDNLNKQREDGLVSRFTIAGPVQTEVTSAPITTKDPNDSRRTVCSGGPMLGTATVTTEISVRPFLLQHLTCASQEHFCFRAKQSFPITYVVAPQLPQDDEQISSRDDADLM